MKRILIVVLLCLVVSSCASKPVSVKPLSTNTPYPTATPTASPTPPPYTSEKDGIFAIAVDRWRFYKWRLSFTFPPQWMAKELPPNYFGPYKVDHFADPDGNKDNWIFYSEPIENESGEKSVAEIRFRFQSIPDGLETGDFSETEWETCSDNGFQIDTVSNPEQIGHDLYQSTLYKCSFVLEGTPKRELYVIHAIHQTRKDVGIEVVLIANSDVFQKMETDFQDFMKRLSFEL